MWLSKDKETDNPEKTVYYGEGNVVISDAFFTPGSTAMSMSRATARSSF